MEFRNKFIVHSVFEDIVGQHPENIAIEDNSRSVTYRELNRYANRVAYALNGLDIGRQSIVGIYSEASIEYIVAILGVLKAGSIFIPLNTHFPDKYLTLILGKTKPQVIITNTSLEDEYFEKIQKLSFPACSSHMIVLDEVCNFIVKNLPTGTPMDSGRVFADENPPLTTGPNDGCYIVTTSGSTGEPKAILGSQKGLSHFIHWEIGEFDLNEKVWVSFLSPVTFDVSLRDIFVPLMTGGTLCIPNEEIRREPKKLLKWMQDSAITITHIVPTLFRLLTRGMEASNNNEDTLPFMKYILIAGEALYGNDVINWRKAAGSRIELVNIYGPSETTLAKLFFCIKDEDFAPNEIVPIGKPIPDTDVLIINTDKLCSINETGEIYLKTPFMSKGYYNDHKLNEISFVQNPHITDRQEIVYKTGDLGEYTPDGNVRFLGRLDRQIKLYGNRIEIGEIEVALSQHPQVYEAAVAIRPDKLGNNRLVGYVVPKPGEKVKVESLRRFLADKLPDYMVPSIFVILKALPLTQNEKIDRRALPKPDHVRPEMEQAYISPSTSLERILSGIWCQVLGLDRVGVQDNFFDLGGTSILAVKVVELAEQEIKIELPIVKLFQYPNISSLAKYLSQSQSDQLSYDKIHDRAQLRESAFSRLKKSKLRNRL